MQPSSTFVSFAPDGSALIEIHVVPNAARTGPDGLHDGALRVRLKAPPVEGRANEALVAWLADTLDVRRAEIELVRGHTARRKRLRLAPAAAGRAAWSRLSQAPD
jgi:hypothetical protein